jgi:hypothetical protein
MKIYVYSYRSAHRHVCCSSGTFCRGCVASLSTRRRAASCNKWWGITNLGTTSRKEHCCPSFYWASKRCEKQWGCTHKQTQLSTLCVDAVFHRNFSAVGGPDQHVLPAILGQTSWTQLATTWNYVARHYDFYCVSSADGTWLERHTAWLLV